MFSQIIDSFCARWLKLSQNQEFIQPSLRRPPVLFDGINEGIQGMNVRTSDSVSLESESHNINQLSSLARIGLEMVGHMFAILNICRQDSGVS
jgi:hypothetical protein